MHFEIAIPIAGTLKIRLNAPNEYVAMGAAWQQLVNHGPDGFEAVWGPELDEEALWENRWKLAPAMHLALLVRRVTADHDTRAYCWLMDHLVTLGRELQGAEADSVITQLLKEFEGEPNLI